MHDDKKIDRRMSIVEIIIFLAVALTSFYGKRTHAHVVDWKDTDKAFFSCITNQKKHKGLSAITKSVLCLIVEHTKLGSVTITNSCLRPKSYHHGKNCSATDFYFDDYNGKTIEENADQYIDNLYEMITFLEKIPHLASKMGIGIYLPYRKANKKWSSNGLIIHIDSRGRPSRWARLRGKYVSVNEGIDQFLDDMAWKDASADTKGEK